MKKRESQLKSSSSHFSSTHIGQPFSWNESVDILGLAACLDPEVSHCDVLCDHDWVGLWRGHCPKILFPLHQHQARFLFLFWVLFMCHFCWVWGIRKFFCVLYNCIFTCFKLFVLLLFVKCFISTLWIEFSCILQRVFAGRKVLCDIRHKRLLVHKACSGFSGRIHVWIVWTEPGTELSCLINKPSSSVFL